MGELSGKLEDATGSSAPILTNQSSIIIDTNRITYEQFAENP